MLVVSALSDLCIALSHFSSINKSVLPGVRSMIIKVASWLSTAGSSLCCCCFQEQFSLWFVARHCGDRAKGSVPYGG